MNTDRVVVYVHFRMFHPDSFYALQTICATLPKFLMLRFQFEISILLLLNETNKKLYRCLTIGTNAFSAIKIIYYWVINYWEHSLITSFVAKLAKWCEFSVFRVFSLLMVCVFCAGCHFRTQVHHLCRLQCQHASSHLQWNCEHQGVLWAILLSSYVEVIFNSETLHLIKSSDFVLITI